MIAFEAVVAFYYIQPTFTTISHKLDLKQKNWRRVLLMVDDVWVQIYRLCCGVSPDMNMTLC